MADQKIPYEYHTDFGQAAELEQIAKLMEQQRLLNREGMKGQMVSGHFVRMSPMQGLADLFAAYQGGKARSEAAKIREGAAGRMAADERNELARIAQIMTGSPEKAGPVDPRNPTELAAIPANPMLAAQTATASQFPRVQSFGKELGQRISSNVSASMPHLSPEGRATAAATGQVGGFEPKPQWGPIRNLAPQGAEQILGSVRSDTNEPKFAPKASTTTIELGDRGRGRILEREHEFLNGPDGRKVATQLQTTLESIPAAMNIFADLPMNVGIDADWKTVAQKLAQVTGAEVPAEAAGTELYTKFVVPQVGAIITQFGAGTGLSDADREFAKKAVALATNDPRMIKVAMAFMLRGALKEAAFVNRRVDAARSEAQSLGYNPDMFQPIPIRFTLPDSYGLPPDIMKPGALEAWMQKAIRSKGAQLDDAVKRNLGQQRTGEPF